MDRWRSPTELLLMDGKIQWMDPVWQVVKYEVAFLTTVALVTGVGPSVIFYVVSPKGNKLVGQHAITSELSQT